MGEARLGGAAEGTAQRRGEKSGNSLADTQGSPAVLPGPGGGGGKDSRNCLGVAGASQ